MKQVILFFSLKLKELNHYNIMNTFIQGYLKRSSQYTKRELPMQTSFWKILFRERIAPVSFSFLCSHNSKSIAKRDVDFIERNVSTRMEKNERSQFVQM